ncbi:polysaccharide pyruvyl transferase family protein [Methanococcus maripaludis]|uniref:Pyruvyl transferase n=1 Tax=Methanococcus maripaludis TaxID=39152 RepID=A0A7J9PUI1_METMI|nr:polysaccharide pyruvyl transferase family protein [Methanococcus maripaludis]MBA2869078.1 pyruvyl transferase [Methanococcus maripaludis]
MIVKKIKKLNALHANYSSYFSKSLDEIIFIATSIGIKNWGDALNLKLVEYISGKTPIISYDPLNMFKPPLRNHLIYGVIGSVLEAQSSHRLNIWGSGFISEQGTLKQDPKKIFAVRGPRTRKVLLDLGYQCPKVYGDPAMLYPIYYTPNVGKRYKLGVIPHYIDHNNKWITKLKNDSNVLVINMLNDINKVVDDICSCECIASSSLHGIIAADSYNIPSLWIKLSENVAGDGFKFIDYFESVNRKCGEPMTISGNECLYDILEMVDHYDITIDLHKLMQACPFKKPNIDYKKLITELHPLYI